MQQLDQHAVVVAAEGQVHRLVADEVIVLNLTRGSYYTLAGTAGWIWERLQQPVAVASLCEALVDEFDVDRDDCERDVLSHLADLLQEGMIVVLP